MQVVRGVQFIHSKRILHLDLKPFNIIFANQNDDYNLREIYIDKNYSVESFRIGGSGLTFNQTNEYCGSIFQNLKLQCVVVAKYL